MLAKARNILLTYVPVLGVCFSLYGCGAPVKSAGDVSSIFDTKSGDLQSKVDTLCSTLGSRTTAPSSSIFSEGSLKCGNAGADSQNFGEIDAFKFVGVDDTFKTSEKSKDVKFLEVRAEVWLNKNLLDLASKLGAKMKEGLTTGAAEIKPNGNDKLSGLVTTKIEVVEPSKFDQKTFEFTTKIHFMLSGAVKADHVIAINGKLFDDKFAVSAATEGDQPYEKSILKNFQAIILVVPHAGDVYMDLNVKMNINDIGLGDGVLKDNVHKALSSGLKSAIDSFLGL